MMSPEEGSPSLNTNREVSKHNSILGMMRLWAFVPVFVVALIVLVFLIIHRCYQKSKSFKAKSRSSMNHHPLDNSTMDRRLLSRRISEIEMNIAKLEDHHIRKEVSPAGQWFNNTNLAIALRNGSNSDYLTGLEPSAKYSDAWKGRKFSLKEIEVATNAFANENVIGNGDHCVTYRGVLFDTTRVAIKRLLSSSCRPEDFETQLEPLAHVRHKNLVNLLGYCLEGGFRMLISEYVDNGNLQQWLHGCPEQVSPLTWDVRLNIIQGIAKGLAYLHEDLEPKIVHQDLKSSNVLLDRLWNPKITDFGVAKLSGYLGSQHECDGALNERSDVYSFGLLVMEIICGRPPIDHNQPHIYLVDWLKSMVANQKIMYLADPKLPEMPSSKELKRIVLLALRCVDPDNNHRPTMGDVIHMLEPRDLLLDDECRPRRNTSSRWNHLQEGQAKLDGVDFDVMERDKNNNPYQTIMPNYVFF